MSRYEVWDGIEVCWMGRRQGISYGTVSRYTGWDDVDEGLGLDSTFAYFVLIVL